MVYVVDDRAVESATGRLLNPSLESCPEGGHDDQ